MFGLLARFQPPCMHLLWSCAHVDGTLIGCHFAARWAVRVQRCSTAWWTQSAAALPLWAVYKAVCVVPSHTAGFGPSGWNDSQHDRLGSWIKTSESSVSKEELMLKFHHGWSSEANQGDNRSVSDDQPLQDVELDTSGWGPRGESIQTLSHGWFITGSASCRSGAFIATGNNGGGLSPGPQVYLYLHSSLNS